MEERRARGARGMMGSEGGMTGSEGGMTGSKGE